ncbi:MAG: 2-isopropylmalate synthase [Rhodococcus sp. (in: high G+C Gram-positive bacteria)]|uniref:2-isopropylmalate synthase n=1 Tax=Rhodococcus sp. TaxID=1831 RepID=UPI003BB09F8D
MSTFTSTASHFSAAADSEIDPFAARFGKTLPRDLRIEASGMSWHSFEALYAASGPIRLGSWTRSKSGPGTWEFEATFGIGGSICTSGTTAPGPVSAMTSMLHDLNCGMEILSFHQHRIGERTATFLLCERGGERRWAMGIADSDTDSAMRAMISGANRLHAH